HPSVRYMKLPKFTLVHVGSGKRRSATPDTFASDALLPTELQARLDALKSPLRTALLRSAAPAGHLTSDLLPDATLRLDAVLTDLERQQAVVTIGIWDLGARIGQLPAVVERVNAAQPAFTFFEVQASIPAGLIRPPDSAALLAWLRDRAGPRAASR